MLKTFSPKGLKLIILGVLTYLVGDYLPLVIKEIFYAISLFLKDILVFFLPIIIVSTILSSMLSLKNQAFFFMLLVTSVMIAFYLAHLFGQYAQRIFGPYPVSPPKLARLEHRILSFGYSSFPFLFR